VDLVVCDVLDDFGFESLRLCRIVLHALECSRARNYESVRDFTTIFVFLADDTNISHFGKFKEVAFELWRRDLEAFDFDQVLDSIDDEELLALVDVHFVTSVDPADLAVSIK